HVLSAPPAFVLSQDQTLRRDSGLVRRSKRRGRPCSVRSRPAREAPRSGLSDRPLPGGVWNVRTGARRTEPRSDEALAFTRCSVLKVRTAHVSPHGRKTRAGARRPMMVAASLEPSTGARAP